MKVLFLSSWFPNRVFPFNGDFVQRHALAVSTRCDTAVIYVQSDDNIKEQVFEITEKYSDLLYEIIIYFKPKRSLNRPLNKTLNLLRYGCGYLMGYRILKKKFGKPTIIHANIIFPIALVAYIWSIFTGIPFIISEHWTLFLSERGRHIPSGWIVRRAVKKAYAVIPVTNNLKMALQRHGFVNNYRVIPNVVDTRLFIPNPVMVPRDKVKLLHVSSMKETQKNIMGIIRTIKRLSDIRNDFMITFIGDEQAHQRALAVELGLSEKTILFKGELSHPEVADMMQQSHILVMFSNAENLPCVILEALSCGLPVLSSDVGGIGEWINESNGKLVSHGNEDELLQGLIFMLDNFVRYDKEVLHKYAVDHFSMETIANQYITLYKNAMNRDSHV